MMPGDGPRGPTAPFRTALRSGGLPAIAPSRSWRASDHRLVARGVVGIDGDVAVFDRIVTEPDVRRRGLGSVVLHELAAAANAGAMQRLPITTEDSRALYTRLNWTIVTDVVSLIARPSS